RQKPPVSGSSKSTQMSVSVQPPLHNLQHAVGWRRRAGMLLLVLAEIAALDRCRSSERSRSWVGLHHILGKPIRVQSDRANTDSQPTPLGRLAPSADRDLARLSTKSRKENFVAYCERTVGTWYAVQCVAGSGTNSLPVQNQFDKTILRLGYPELLRIERLGTH